MNNSSVDYWNNRVRQHGHTGINNPLLYRIEQSLRKKILNKIFLALDLSSLSNISVLDFGCGTAELGLYASEILNAKSYTGYDVSPSVLEVAHSQAHSHGFTNFSFTTNLSDLSLRSYDLILSITVIQHVPETLLASTFESLRGFLGSDGILIILDNCYGVKSSPAYIRTYFNRSSIVSTYSDLFGSAPVYSIPHPSLALGLSAYLYRYVRYRFIRLILLFLFVPICVILDRLELFPSLSKYQWLVFSCKS